MVEIDGKIIGDEVFDRKFVCDLAACKGACCVEGDSGAPLEEDELEKIEEVYNKVKPYMRAEGIAAVEKEGFYIIDFDGDTVTPLVNGKECAYVNFDASGTAKCSIEQAFRDGKIDFPKPISCHLYPIRISKLSIGDAINYNNWQICKPACECGEKLDVPVYKFLKEPLIRKYNEEFFSLLEIADKMRRPKL